MLYLSQMLGEPVVDANGEKIGSISDLAIQTGEVFPRITSLAFLGPGKTPFMISWRKYVDSFDEDEASPESRPHCHPLQLPPACRSALARRPARIGKSWTRRA